MTHVVRGMDSDGALLMDVVVTGNVPYLPPGSPVTLQPYTGLCNLSFIFFSFLNLLASIVGTVVE